MLPAHQRLEAGDALLAQVDNRVVMEDDLVAVERVLELGPQRVSAWRSGR